MKVILRNARIVSPSEGLDIVADILIDKGIIKDIRKGLATKKAIDEIDLKGKAVVPGLFDMHVHFLVP